MAIYETLVLIDPSLGEDELSKYVKKLDGLASQQKGKIVKDETLGRKKLAYPINKKTEGTYIRLEVQLEPKALHDFERSLRLESKILREMTLRLN